MKLTKILQEIKIVNNKFVVTDYDDAEGIITFQGIKNFHYAQENSRGDAYRLGVGSREDADKFEEEADQMGIMYDLVSTPEDINNEDYYYIINRDQFDFQNKD